MKLFYMPGACSLAPHIALQEAGLSFDLERVGRDKKTEAGENYLTINPKGSVPVLKLDNGEVLTEAAVIQQYIGDKPPAKKLLPSAGTPGTLSFAGMDELYRERGAQGHRPDVQSCYARRL
jgi:glutathione S-transferase